MMKYQCTRVVEQITADYTTYSSYEFEPVAADNNVYGNDRRRFVITVERDIRSLAPYKIGARYVMTITPED